MKALAQHGGIMTDCPIDNDCPGCLCPSGHPPCSHCVDHTPEDDPVAKFRIYFDDEPGRKSWTLRFPDNAPMNISDLVGDGICGMTFDEACEGFRAALHGEDALRAFLGPAWAR